MTDLFDEYERNTIRELKFAIRDIALSGFSELNDELHSFLQNYGIITGGITASILHRGEINDIDIFLTDDDKIKEFKKLISIKQNIQDEIKDINPKYMVETEIEGKLITANAVTFKNKVQVITCSTQNARKTFDFVHCMPYYDFVNDRFYISKLQYNSIINKQLVVNSKTTQPIRMHRIEKFVERGWSKPKEL